MTDDTIYQRAMKLLTIRVSNLDAARESGDQEDARNKFFLAVGTLSALSYLRVISTDQYTQLNDDLFDNHYYL